jgi:5-methylcytosine-specific restriction endonuclease McrA
MILTPKNWNEFQHYKDRSPPWIKLHRGLLDNMEYHRLSPEAAKYLPLIWLIASERDGQVPAGAELAFRLHIEEELANDIVTELMGANFLVEGSAETTEQTATLAQRVAKSNGFGNRHISDATKRAVWERDGGKCCGCGGVENIEYDHKVPVSKGGNSDESNIQLLCRPCNRAKRTKLATPAQPLRSLEKEGEKRREERDARADDWPSDFREAFWSEYPHKVGRAAALQKLEGVRKRGVSWSVVLAGLRAYKRDKPADRQWCNPATWLHQERWLDQPADGKPSAAPVSQDWEMAAKMWASIGRWPKGHGNDPDSPACQAPIEILRKHGIQPLGA